MVMTARATRSAWPAVDYIAFKASSVCMQIQVRRCSKMQKSNTCRAAAKVLSMAVIRELSKSSRPAASSNVAKALQAASCTCLLLSRTRVSKPCAHSGMLRRHSYFPF